MFCSWYEISKGGCCKTQVEDPVEKTVKLVNTVAKEKNSKRRLLCVNVFIFL